MSADEATENRPSRTTDDAVECPLTARQQTRNLLLYGANVALIYLDAPVLHAEMAGVTNELLAAAGPDVHIDAAFDKMQWRLHDERFPVRLLPPYHGASDAGFRRFAEAVRIKYPR